jgi:hypothetical protein
VSIALRPGRRTINTDPEETTVRFIAFVKGNDDIDYPPPTPEMVAPMAAYNQKLVDAGVLIDLNGLEPPSRGARITFGGGKGTIADGPFAEAKEVIGGYWILECASLAEAERWISEAPMDDGGVIELRQIFALEDQSRELQEAAKLEGFAQP